MTHVVARAAAKGRSAARAGGLAVITSLMLPAYLAAHARAAPARRQHVRDMWVRSWARTLLQLFSIHVRIQGSVSPPTPGRGRLVVANHRSAIDIGALLAAFGGSVVSRADVARWPILGPAARATGTLFVDRSNPESRAATVRALDQRLEEGGTIVLFPEGATFAGDEVRPFHAGAFGAALRSGAEIVPVGIAYPEASAAAYLDVSFMQHLLSVAESSEVRAALAVGEPFMPNAAATPRECAAEARARVQELVTKARRDVGP